MPHPTRDVMLNSSLLVILVAVMLACPADRQQLLNACKTQRAPLHTLPKQAQKELPTHLKDCFLGKAGNASEEVLGTPWCNGCKARIAPVVDAHEWLEPESAGFTGAVVAKITAVEDRLTLLQLGKGEYAFWWAGLENGKRVSIFYKPEGDTLRPVARGGFAYSPGKHNIPAQPHASWTKPSLVSMNSAGFIPLPRARRSVQKENSWVECKPEGCCSSTDVVAQ